MTFFGFATRKSAFFIAMNNSLMHAAVKTIKEIYRQLEACRDLSPRGPNVTFLHTELMNILKMLARNAFPVFQELAKCPDLSRELVRLPLLCGKIECELEHFWSHLLVKQMVRVDLDNRWIVLKRFCYLHCYNALVLNEEILLAESPAADAEHRVFLGSGSLPLTAILACWWYPHVHYTCVDSDPLACTLSSQLISLLGLSNRITVVQAEAVEYCSHQMVNTSTLVIMANLLKIKHDLYCILFTMQVQWMLIRTVQHAYCFLYSCSVLPFPDEYTEVGRSKGSAMCTSVLYKTQK